MPLWSRCTCFSVQLSFHSTGARYSCVVNQDETSEIIVVEGQPGVNTTYIVYNARDDNTPLSRFTRTHFLQGHGRGNSVDYVDEKVISPQPNEQRSHS
jgi:hypothetical protein